MLNRNLKALRNWLIWLRIIRIAKVKGNLISAKFQTWHSEHEVNITRRSDEHRKTQRAKKAYVPIVKKVEPRQEEAAEGAAEATTEA